MKDRFLIWNDDNHESCVWCNNEYVGAEFETTLKNLLYINPQSKTKECEILQICPWDFTEGEYKVEEPEDDKLFKLFQKTPKFSEEQWNLIFKKNWKNLIKTL